MKQILQSLKTGLTEVTDVPVPKVSSGSLLIKTSKTLISAGTEKMLLEFGKAGWINKARQQPDKVKLVLKKIANDGIKPTLETVFQKIDQPLPLGYCNVGVIHELDHSIKNFKKGDRVISNGKHAEVVNVPVNLCAKVPDVVTDQEASFTVLGAVALQGIRLVKPTLGETVVVIGLGLVGLMTVQLLKANGCRVLGLDFDQEKIDLAKKFGAEVVNLNKEDPLKIANIFSRGRGVDAVVVTASTSSDEPIHQAAQMCRKRARIVLVGVTGLNISRDDFYKKELTFQVSASYGPGRYDPNYEEKGHDYPIGFVRWTEQRNFEAVLDMMESGVLDVNSLISHKFNISDANKAYDLISGSIFSLGIILNYPGIEINKSSKTISLSNNKDKEKLKNDTKTNKISLNFIGSGNYATSVLIPAFRDAGSIFHSIASNTGVSGVYAGRKYGFKETTTDVNDIFNDTSTNALVIATRHNTHAELTLKGIHAKKNIFVEKPLCLTLEELDKIENAYSNSSSKILMVGFNRRFAPHVKKMKELLSDTSGPKAMVMIINAGEISKDHWTQDLEVGGGRIKGEVCHFVDLLRFIANYRIIDYQINIMNNLTKDTVSIQLYFEDGSIGTIHYFANGSSDFPKEKLEVFTDGKILKLDNYRKLTGFGWTNFKKMNLWQQDKGQKSCTKAFIDSISDGSASPIPIEEIFEVSKISIDLANH